MMLSVVVVSVNSVSRISLKWVDVLWFFCFMFFFVFVVLVGVGSG